MNDDIFAIGRATLRELRDDPAVWPILQERARSLARRDEITDADVGESILTFQLGTTHYSFPVTFIREVQPLPRITRLPAVPAYCAGLVNIRGRLLAAFDLRPLLGLPVAPLAATAHLIILTTHTIDIGLVVDSVAEVQPGARELMATPASIAGRSVAWVRGVDRQMTIYLDAPLLVADPRLALRESSVLETGASSSTC